MIIVCDIDNVLNDLTVKTVDLYNRMHKKSILLSDLTSYNFSDCLPEEDANAIVELFKNKDLWDSLEPLQDSQWAIATLLNIGHRVVFATSTHACNFKWKCDWMQRFFPMVDTHDIICIHDKSLLNADVIIDDCMEQLTKSCCDRICLDYVWNRDNDKDFVYDIRRAHNWKEIIKLINNIEKENKEWKE